jgi:hypothetical protein
MSSELKYILVIVQKPNKQQYGTAFLEYNIQEFIPI